MTDEEFNSVVSAGPPDDIDMSSELPLPLVEPGKWVYGGEHSKYWYLEGRNE